MKLENQPWWSELVAVKDVLSLRELSGRFGAAPAAIANALRRNGLERRAAPSGPRGSRNASWHQAAAPVRAPVVHSPAVLAASAPTPERSHTVRGYRATIGTEAYVIVAPDIATATQTAVRASRGQVVAVDLLGAALTGAER